MRMRKKKNCGARMEQCAALWEQRPEENKGMWTRIFGNTNPVHLEIGCGKGQFIAEMAHKYPDINFIAMDVVPDVLVLALEKAIPLGLKNVRFMLGDAARLPEYFESGEVGRIYLNFSDPWKKNKQAKRRLTHKNFLDLYKQLMPLGSGVFFKTDNKSLFEFSLNSFAQENFKLSQITLDLHNSGYEENVMTEYEEKFARQGLPIYRLEARYYGWIQPEQKTELGVELRNI